MNDDAEHFHEFGRVSNIVHIHNDVHTKTFVQRPRIHQFIKAGQIHRAKEKRPVGQFELFLDLVMVGVVHQLADLASETEDGMAVARFVLTFWGAWSIWSDYRNYVNTSGMDDFPQRVYTLCMMAILIGYSANSTGVEIEHNKYLETHSAKVSMKGAVGFLLVAKCIRFVLYCFYALYLPEFFFDQMLHAVWLLVAAGLYLGAMFSTKIQTGTILFGAAGIVENIQLFFGVMLARIIGKRQQKLCSKNVTGWFMKRVKAANIAVINIEHAADRNGAFFTIVLGESVTNLLYQVAKYPNSAGVTPYYGRAFCILLVSFTLNWLYFTEDWTVEKVHPVRRHWLSAIVYQFGHWPMTAGLIISSASVAQLVHPGTDEERESQAARYYWGSGMAVAIFCLAIIDLLPKWDFWTWDRAIVQITRLFFRLSAVAICATVPLAPHSSLTNLGFVGVYASVFVFLVGEEMIGKLIIMRYTKRYEDKEMRFKEAQANAAPSVFDDICEDPETVVQEESTAVHNRSASSDDSGVKPMDSEETGNPESARDSGSPHHRHAGSVSSVSSVETLDEERRHFGRTTEFTPEAAGPHGPC